MSGISTTTVVVIVGVVGLGALLYFNPGIFTQSIVTQSTDQGTPGGNQFAATLQARAINAITGAPINVNMEVYDSNDNMVIGQINANAALTSLSAAMPNTFNGYIIAGNDNYAADSAASWTDRGDEYWLTKFPISYSNRVGIVVPTGADSIRLYQEVAPTWTCFDNNAVEAEGLCSVVVGSGAQVDDAKFKISIGTASTALGNPYANGQNPLIMCINTTQTGVGHWDDVRPLNHAGEVPVPEWLGNRSVVNNKCYALPIDALVDSPVGGKQTYEDNIRLKAKAGQNPTVNSNVTLFLIGKNLVKNDMQQWVWAYGYDSKTRADSQTGFDAEADASVLGLGIS